MPLTEVNINSTDSISSSNMDYFIVLKDNGSFGRLSVPNSQSIVLNGGDFNGLSLTNFTVSTNEISDTTYTLLDSDAGKLLVFSASSDVTVTMPNNLTAGFSCALIQDGTGQVILSAASGTTTLSYSSYDRTAGQGAVLSLMVLSNAGAAARYLIAGNGATE